MDPRDLFCSLALCNRYLSDCERAGIEDAALLSMSDEPEDCRLAEAARVRAGYGDRHRHMNRQGRGLPTGAL